MTSILLNPSFFWNDAETDDKHKEPINDRHKGHLDGQLNTKDPNKPETSICRHDFEKG